MLRFLRPTTPDQLPDEELLQRYVRREDVRALGTLYERYMPMVYGVCLKILKDAGQSEDATLAIFEELLRKTREHEVENFRGWLYVLARNHALMQWRKKHRHPTEHLAPEQMSRFDAPTDDPAFELPEKTNALERCLAGLADLQRRCVQLFYYEDNSYKEISEMLGLELGLVRSHIQNGKRNLRNCLTINGLTTN